MGKVSVAFLAFGVSVLAACSSGGGGGAATVPAPVPAAPPVTPAGAPVNLQGAGVRVAYPAAAITAGLAGVEAGSVITAASGQGATITLGTNASGNLNALIFDVPRFSLQYPAPALNNLSSPQTTDSISSVLNENFGSANSVGATLSQAAAGQTLSASAYGLWLYTGTNYAQVGSFAFGNLTPGGSVPATGSATFSGFAVGVDSTLNDRTVYFVQGNAQIIANFATQTVTTNLTNLTVGTEPYFAPPPTITSLPNLSGTSTMSGNAYSGSISGGALSGTINGNFYGPAAQETAGVWQASGGGNTWIGSFGAK